MRPVDRLRFHRRVPPRIEQVHVVGRREIEPVPTGLEADQEHGTVGVGLEPVHARLAIARATIEVLVHDSLGVESLAHQRQERRELREHQRLVSFGRDFLERRNQRVELGARNGGMARVHERRMAGCLSQAQQGLEDVHARLLHPLAFDTFEHTALVVHANVFVHAPLLGLHFDFQGLLDAGGQFARHVLLLAPKDDGPQRACQQRPVGGLRLHGRRRRGKAAQRCQPGGRTHHAGIQELQQAPQLLDTILDRRAAQCQSMIGAQQPARLGRGGAGVLDCLRFVEDGVVEGDLGELARVAAQRAIGGDHDIDRLRVDCADVT